MLKPKRITAALRGDPAQLIARSLVVLTLLLTACAPAQFPERPPSASESPQVSSPKRITAGILGNPPTVNNRINSTGAGGIVAGASEIESLLHAGLVTSDDRKALLPQLAEAVPSLENGLWKIFPDGTTTTTWKIRQGAQWHDGAPFTSDDVVFTVEIGQDRELSIFRSTAFETVGSVEAGDPQTVTVVWKRPYIYADSMFGEGLLPRHLLGGAYRENKLGIPHLAYWNEEFVGTGAYRLREWVKDSHVVLEANGRYVLGRPSIDEIEVKFFTDSNTLIANILAGSVELTLGRALSIEQAIQVRDLWREGAMGVPPPFTWIVIYPQLLNPSPAAVADVRLRRALLHAIDRQQMVEAIQGGLVSVAHSFLNPDEPEYRDVERTLVKYDYDPRRATQLIEEIGYARGPDGIFRSDSSGRDAAAQRLGVEIRTTGGEDIHEKSLFSVADSWQRVGVAVEPVVIPQARSRDQQYRATFPGFQVLQQPNNTSNLIGFHSSSTPLAENNFVGGNRPRYRSPEFDELIDRFFVTIPHPERTRVLAQLMRHISEQLVMMGLFYNVQPTMIGNRLRNVPAGKPGWNVQEWDVR